MKQIVTKESFQVLQDAINYPPVTRKEAAQILNEALQDVEGEAENWLEHLQLLAKRGQFKLLPRGMFSNGERCWQVVAIDGSFNFTEKNLNLYYCDY